MRLSSRSTVIVVDQAGELAALGADRLDGRRQRVDCRRGRCRRCASSTMPRLSTTSSATTTIATRPGAGTSLRRVAAAGRAATGRVGLAASAMRPRLTPHRVARPSPRAAVPAVTAGTVDPMAISGVADLTGRVLAGRYRLLAPIGAGASGRVYVADDVRLRRRVAVKVLHAALAEDAGFLRRFRAEAQVAASLQPPERDGGLRLGRRRRAVHGARAAHAAAACAACSTPARG